MATPIPSDADAHALAAKKSEINELLVQQMAIEKWNGDVPSWYMPGGGGIQPNLFMSIPETVTGEVQE